MHHWPPLIKARLQRLDHAMIFVLIAGSYTPVALLALGPAWGITFLVLAWGIAVGGAILAVWHIGTIHRYSASCTSASAGCSCSRCPRCSDP